MVDNVVALVDAKHGMEKLDEGDSGQGTACAQICFASTVLLNKIDLVDQEHLDKARHGSVTELGLGKVISSPSYTAVARMRGSGSDPRTVAAWVWERNFGPLGTPWDLRSFRVEHLGPWTYTWNAGDQNHTPCNLSDPDAGTHIESPKHYNLIRPSSFLTSFLSVLV